MTAREAAEFSYPVAVADLTPDGRDFAAAASAEERAALAARFGLVAVDRFAVDGRLEPSDDGVAVRLRAHLVADVVQTCVATLDPVASRIDSEFERLFSRAIDDEWDGPAEIDAGQDGGSDEAFPEPLVDGRVDIGEIAAQQLALELDPFPRAPGAEGAMQALQGQPAGSGSEESGPFAALAALKPRLRGQE